MEGGKKREDDIPSGRVMTIAEYFEENPQSIHIINNDPMRQGVVLNGRMIELGTPEWYNMAGTRIVWNTLIGDIEFLYHTHGK